MTAPSRYVYVCASAGALGLAVGSRQQRDGYGQAAALVIGLGGLLAAALRWQREDVISKGLEQHADLMNGYFLTGGAASAVSGDPAQVTALRGLLGIPRRRKRHADQVP